VPKGYGVRAMRLYRGRWAIETLFHVWSLDRPKPRAKRIYSRVIHFAALAYLKTLTLRAYVERIVTWPGKKTSTFWQVTTIEIARWILRPPPDPDTG